uniref:Uncharacterized protein n=1 Tax=Thermus caliditerrae TaxID=1330700 RepID=A0A7C5VEX8_9DEIN
MASHTVEVARLSPHRYVTRCGCGGGTYHLHWDAGTFRLTEEAVRYLVRVLGEILSPEGAGVVWLGSVGLRLARGEGWQLQRLLAESLRPEKEVPELQAVWLRYTN